MFGLCSGFSNVPQPGQYALETFRKVPAVGGLLGNLSSLVGGGGFSGLTNLVGNFTGIGSGGQQGQQGQQPQGINNLIANWGNSWNNQPAQNNQVINIPPAFDPSNFQNNVPLDSIKSNDNNFNELINSGQPGQVVKKILKSNYTDLLK